MIGHDQVLELIPLYALDALEGGEQVDVQAHLETCDRCMSELRIHAAVAAGFIEDGPAPQDVWNRIEESLDDSIEADVIPISPSKAADGSVVKWILGAAAAAALVFGGVLVGQRIATTDLATDAGVIAAAESAANDSESIVSDFVVDDVAVARVVVTSDGLGYVIPNENLETLGPDRTYQLWVITPDELVISAGLLGNEPGPATFTWTEDIAGFALTREVAGGVVSSAGDVVSVIET